MQDLDGLAHALQFTSQPDNTVLANMPDALAVSPSTVAPSPKKIEKSSADKPETAAGTEDEAREFATVLEQAVETPALDAAMVDPTAAIPAVTPAVLAAETAANEGGELGIGGAPLTDSRPAATLLPLRPEARAALQAAMPEAAAAMKQGAASAHEAATDAQADAAQAQAGDERRFEQLGAPGKPFENLVERAATPTAASERVETAAPTNVSTTPAAAEAAAESARRERPAVLKLDTALPVHSPRFHEGFNQQVVVLAQHGIQQAQLSLSPQDLGPVDVRITVAHDEASVQIAAPSGVAREAIQEALPRLKEMMEQSGVRLNDASVFAQLPERDRSDGTQTRGEAWTQHGTRGEQGSADTTELPLPVTIRHLGLIDAYA